MTCENLIYNWSTRVSVGTGEDENVFVQKNVVTSKQMESYDGPRKITISAAGTHTLALNTMASITTLLIEPDTSDTAFTVAINGGAALSCKRFFADVAATGVVLGNPGAAAITLWVLIGKKL